MAYREAQGWGDIRPETHEQALETIWTVIRFFKVAFIYFVREMMRLFDARRDWSRQTFRQARKPNKFAGRIWRIIIRGGSSI